MNEFNLEYLNSNNFIQTNLYQMLNVNKKTFIKPNQGIIVINKQGVIIGIFTIENKLNVFDIIPIELNYSFEMNCLELILKYISELLKNTANVNIINFCKPVILYYSPTILKFRTLGKKTIDLFSNNIPIESFEYILEPTFDSQFNIINIGEPMEIEKSFQSITTNTYNVFGVKKN